MTEPVARLLLALKSVRGNRSGQRHHHFARINTVVKIFL
jgi:hypothetical protein